MLKLTDTGVEIRLTGTPAPNYALIFAGLLGVLALVVAYLAITQAVVIAIGGIFALAVGCFFFNHYKEKLKNQPITGETLSVRPFELSFASTTLTLDEHSKVALVDNQLVIWQGNKTWRFSGFANHQEQQIVQKVLLGQQIAGRKVAIKMGSH